MNLIQDMNELLTDEILEYCMSLFVDTRLSLDLKNQFTNEPPGLSTALSFMIKNKELLPKVISNYSIKAQYTAVEIERTIDPIRRIALWGDYIKKYGRDS